MHVTDLPVAARLVVTTIEPDDADRFENEIVAMLTRYLTARTP